jgi:hypothetical protein
LLSQQSVTAPTPRLRLRLIKEALPPPVRLTAKGVARVALDLALTMPIHDALTRAIATLGEPGTMTTEQIERIALTAFKLISEGLRVDDAVSVALHERVNPRPSPPLREATVSRFIPPHLTGQNVVKLALELNATGHKMDDALIEALKRFSEPRPISHEQAHEVLEAAQKLFTEGVRAVEAFNIALRRTLLKSTCTAA